MLVTEKTASFYFMADCWHACISIKYIVSIIIGSFGGGVFRLWNGKFVHTGEMVIENHVTTTPVLYVCIMVMSDQKWNHEQIKEHNQNEIGTISMYDRKHCHITVFCVGKSTATILTGVIEYNNLTQILTGRFALVLWDVKT